MTLSYQYDLPNDGDGLDLLYQVRENNLKPRVVIFDPQYRGVLDQLAFGNEGNRQRERTEQRQQPLGEICSFLEQISMALDPSGYLFMWMDKQHLIHDAYSTFSKALGPSMKLVDMIVWDKDKIGMGYRSRRQSEFVVAYQKTPILAKKTWVKHDIPDVWREKVVHHTKRSHPHEKPIGLTTALLEATTKPGDLVVDPCAGGYSTLRACEGLELSFLGTNLE